MALQINTGTGKKTLFSALLTNQGEPEDFQHICDLFNPEFVFGFYTLKATFNTPTGPVTRSVEFATSITALLKGTAGPSAMGAAKQVLLKLMKTITTEGVPVIPSESVQSIAKTEAPQSASDAFKAMLKAKVAKIDNYETLPPEPVVKAKPQAKPKNEVVLLRDAKALLQPVFGTSTGSVYYACAISERVRVAVRLVNDSVSLRAEGNPSKEEAALLQAAGLSNHGKYWSMHLNCNNVPPKRAVGAFLMGLGIDFDETITTVKGIPNAN